jgi:hypothetical protein
MKKFVWILPAAAALALLVGCNREIQVAKASYEDSVTTGEGIDARADQHAAIDGRHFQSSGSRLVHGLAGITFRRRIGDIVADGIEGQLVGEHAAHHGIKSGKRRTHDISPINPFLFILPKLVLTIKRWNQTS